MKDADFEKAKERYYKSLEFPTTYNMENPDDPF